MGERNYSATNPTFTTVTECPNDFPNMCTHLENGH